MWQEWAQYRFPHRVVMTGSPHAIASITGAAHSPPRSGSTNASAILYSDGIYQPRTVAMGGTWQ